MPTDVEVVNRIMARHAERYAKARSMKRWRPPEGVYSVLFTDLDVGTFEAKDQGKEVHLRMTPIFQILDGELSGKTFASNSLLTNNEGSMGDFHLMVELLTGKTLQPPSFDQDRQLLLDLRGKVMATLRTAERIGKKGDSYPDDTVEAAQLVGEQVSAPQV